jgi:hypothetical protein
MKIEKVKQELNVDWKHIPPSGAFHIPSPHTVRVDYHPLDATQVNV